MQPVWKKVWLLFLYLDYMLDIRLSLIFFIPCKVPVPNTNNLFVLRATVTLHKWIFVDHDRPACVDPKRCLNQFHLKIFAWNVTCGYLLVLLEEGEPSKKLLMLHWYPPLTVCPSTSLPPHRLETSSWNPLRLFHCGLLPFQLRLFHCPSHPCQ